MMRRRTITKQPLGNISAPVVIFWEQLGGLRTIANDVHCLVLRGLKGSTAAILWIGLSIKTG